MVRIRYRIMLLFAVMLCLSCFEPADKNKTDSGIHEDFSGSWQSEQWGVLHLEQSNDMVTGYYEFQSSDGFIYGHVSGRVESGRLSCIWWQDQNESASYEDASQRGTGFLNYEDNGDFLQGKWRGELDEEWAGNWILERKTALPVDLIMIVLILLLLSTIYATVSSFAPVILVPAVPALIVIALTDKQSLPEQWPIVLPIILLYVFSSFCFSRIFKNTSPNASLNMFWIPGCLPLETDRLLGRNYGFGLIGLIPVLNTVFWITMWTKLIKKLPAPNNKIIWIKANPKIFTALMFVPVLNLLALGYLAFSIKTK